MTLSKKLEQKNKLFSLLLIILLTTSTLLTTTLTLPTPMQIEPAAAQTPSIIDQSPVSGGQVFSRSFSTLSSLHPSQNNGYSSAGQGFVGNGFFVTEAQFNLRRSALPYPEYTEYICAAIYASTGNNFASALPTGTPLAVSYSVEFADIEDTAVNVMTSFYFNGMFQAQKGVNYFIVVFCDSNLATLGASITVYGSTSNEFSNGGNSVRFNANAWSQWNTGFVIFSVWGVSGEDPTFEVNYFANNPVGTVVSGGVPVDSNQYTVGSVVTVLGNPGGLAVEGYSFLGWEFYGESDPPSFSVVGNSVVPSAFIIGAGNVALFGVWSKVVLPPTPTPSLTPSLPPVLPSDVETVNLFFRGDEFVTFGVGGFGLGDSSTAVVGGFGSSFGGATAVAVSYRVWLLLSNGDLVELTEGVPVAVTTFVPSVNGTFSGYVSGVWNCPAVPVLFGDEALYVVMYSAAADGINTVARAEFVSPVLMTNYIIDSSWVFTSWVDYNSTSFSVSWSGRRGSAGIGNVVIASASDFDLMFFKLINLDVVGFVLYPYVAVFGSFFYVLSLVGILGAYYIWHRKVSIVLFMLILFGSAGGLVFVFLPLPANLLVWALMAVAMAVLLFRVFR